MRRQNKVERRIDKDVLIEIDKNGEREKREGMGGQL